jgi:hypothetical protein
MGNSKCELKIKVRVEIVSLQREVVFMCRACGTTHEEEHLAASCCRYETSCPNFPIR